jgi:hypothetical protein
MLGHQGTQIALRALGVYAHFHDMLIQQGLSPFKAGGRDFSSMGAID